MTSYSGLYILSNKLLQKLKTVKFGMSMRLNYRWQDYLQIFNDSEYLFCYIINKSKNDILSYERDILYFFKDKQSKYFQTEYLKIDVNELHGKIIEYLNNKNIEFKILEGHTFKRIYDNKPETFDPIKLYKPNDHQLYILNNIEEFYNINNIGHILWACGLGKALLGILIIKKLNYKLVVIGVPSIYLQKQMKNEIMKIFDNYKNILFVGGENEYNDNYTIYSTTNEKEISRFIKEKSNDCKFIITTYSSCYLLTEKYNFDFKIGDEAHHLVGQDKEITKDSFHKIKSNKTLFMTATGKIIENQFNIDKDNIKIYSMDDKNIFGNCIDTKTIKWAIENKKITDYNLIIIKNTESEIDLIINNLNVKQDDIISIKKNKELFLSAFMALKSIETYEDLTHLLIYTNKTENAELVKNFIDIILKLNIINVDKNNYYNKALHSNNKDSIFENELKEFTKSNWGIISCVYIFGEGFDCPKLNGVVFGENMDSDIRIVQSTLRPNRLDYNFPNKKAYVIIPYTENNNISFEKCRKIIAKIRNLDETIEQKIIVMVINNNNNDNDNLQEGKNTSHSYLIENSDELNKIILRLRYSKALISDCSEEEDEYNYIKQINKELNIQNKEEYFLVKDIHNYYIDNPEEYFISKCVWTNWYDFLGVDTAIFIQDKNKWINFCKNKNVKSLDDYYNLCKLYKELPKYPIDFYKDFSNIINELNINKRRR
jgi:predicted helicase